MVVNMSKDLLKNLLKEAYEAGWYGTLELADDHAEKILKANSVYFVEATSVDSPGLDPTGNPVYGSDESQDLRSALRGFPPSNLVSPSVRSTPDPSWYEVQPMQGSSEQMTFVTTVASGTTVSGAVTQGHRVSMGMGTLGSSNMSFRRRSVEDTPVSPLGTNEVVLTWDFDTSQRGEIPSVIDVIDEIDSPSDSWQNVTDS